MKMKMKNINREKGVENTPVTPVTPVAQAGERFLAFCNSRATPVTPVFPEADMESQAMRSGIPASGFMKIVPDSFLKRFGRLYNIHRLGTREAETTRCGFSERRQW